MRNLWAITAKRHKTKHPTEKPEDLLERIILLGSRKKSMILDPFMGSGTTGVVAKRLNRNFIGIEIDKDYFKIANERINSEKEVEDNKIQFIEMQIISSIEKQERSSIIRVNEIFR